MIEEKKVNQELKIKSTINICLQYKEKIYILETICISGNDIYLFNKNKFHTYSEATFVGNRNATNAVINYDHITPEDALPKLPPFEAHTSIHEFRKINTKSNDNKFNPRRGYSNLLSQNKIVDFFLFIPKDPLKNVLEKKHEKDNSILLRLPDEFDNQKNGLELKMGIAPKNITPDQENSHKKTNPQSLKMNLPSFNLYLSYRPVGIQRKGLHMTITEE